MEILSEEQRVVVDMQCEWEEKELALILNYAHDNIPQEKLDELLVSWAFEDILRKQLNLMDEQDAQEQLELSFDEESV